MLVEFSTNNLFHFNLGMTRSSEYIKKPKSTILKYKLAQEIHKFFFFKKQHVFSTALNWYENQKKFWNSWSIKLWEINIRIAVRIKAIQKLSIHALRPTEIL